jgi:lipoate-protein ligase A
MATDEALLRAVAAGHAPPTLRIYGWSPPALTLGRGQSIADADIAALIADDVTLLRRATGGTAVYHDETELTYTVATQSAEPRFAGGVAESYQGISAALITALEHIGLQHAQGESHAENRSPRTERDPVCFVVPSDYEITIGQRKLVGSAQMRIRGGILQHGSLYLRGDVARICDYLSAHPTPEHVRAHALSLYEALQHDVSWDSMAQAIVTGFTVALNIDLVRASLLPAERKDVEYLLSEKYANEEWTRRL